MVSPNTRRGLVVAAQLFFFSISASCLAADYRVWTDNAGHTADAMFAGVEGPQIKLVLRNGSVIKVAFSQLVAADQAYVRQQVAAGTPAPATPAPVGTVAPTTPAPLGAAPAKPPGTWPTVTELAEPIKVTVVKEAPETKEYIYRTQHFEFRCDSRLGADVVREFGRTFEGTLQLNKLLPLGIDPKPEDGQEFFVARVFTDKEDYLANGGVQGSAGVYSSGAKSVLVPIASLGVKLAGKHYTVEPNSNNDTLIHEITHQMMNHWLGKLPEWYIEGSAMFCGSAVFHPSGRFTLPKLGQTVKELQHLRAGKHTLWHLNYLLPITRKQWAAAFGSDPDGTVHRNYSSAVAVTYYFYRGDDKGDGAHMIAFMKDIAAGKKWQQAMEEHLVRGRPLAEIEKEITTLLRRGNMVIDWADGPAGSTSAN